MERYQIQQTLFVDLAVVIKVHVDLDKLKIKLVVITIKQTPESLVSII